MNLRNTIGKRLSAGLCSLLLLTGCSAPAANPTAATPDAAAVAYVEAIEEGDMNKVRSMETDTFRADDIYSQFSQGFVSVFNGTSEDSEAFERLASELMQEAFTSPAVVSSEEQDGSATVELSVSGIALENAEVTQEASAQAAANITTKIMTEKQDEIDSLLADESLDEQDFYTWVLQAMLEEMKANPEQFAKDMIEVMDTSEKTITVYLDKTDDGWKVSNFSMPTK